MGRCSALVGDACDGLKALLRLIEFVQMSMIYGTEELAHKLGALNADFPMLIALPILLNAYVFTSERGGPRSVSSMLGLPGPEERYRLGCLMGFGRAKGCTVAVGQSARHAHEPTEALVRPCR